MEKAETNNLGDASCRRFVPLVDRVCVGILKLTSRPACAVAAGTCYDGIRQNFPLEDLDSCVPSASSVFCS